MLSDCVKKAAYNCFSSVSVHKIVRHVRSCNVDRLTRGNNIISSGTQTQTHTSTHTRTQTHRHTRKYTHKK